MDDFTILEQKSVLTAMYDEILTMIKTALQVAILGCYLILPSPAILSAQEVVSTKVTPEEKSTKSDGTSPSTNAVSDFSRDDPIKVVYPVVMAPYSFEDDKGQPRGLAPDLLRLWSKKTNIPIQFTSAAWDEGLQMMREGQADVHASLYYTEQRDTYLDYATVVSSSAGSIFFHKNILGLSGPEDLMAYRVGAVRGGYHEQYIRENLPEVSLVSYPEFPEMLDAALKGDIRVFVEDVGATIYRLKERGLVDEFRQASGRPLYSNNFWLGVREGDRTLTQLIRQGMALITAEERAALERKWLGHSSVKTRDTLTIAIQADFSPYTFINAEGQPAGLFVDIWEAWSKKTGRPIDFRASNWNESLNSLKTGDADIHSGLFYSDSRAQWINYARPYYETGSCLYYTGSKRLSGDLADLAGKTVGVVKGSFQEEYLRDLAPSVEISTFATIEQMLRAMQTGKIAAGLLETLSATALISRLGLSGEFNVCDTVPFTKKFHAGVLRGNPKLLALVRDGFAALSEDELSRIERHWIADSQKRNYEKDKKKIELTTEEQVWLKEHPIIRIGLPEGLEPYVMADEQGNQSGILVDFLNELNRVLASQMVLKTMPSSQIFEMSKSRDIDVIYAVEPEKAKAEKTLSTDIWAIGYPAIYAREGISIKTPDDMAGKTVVQRINTTWDDNILQPFGSTINIVYAETPLEAMKMVINEEADLYLGLTSHNYAITKYRLFGISQFLVFDDAQVSFSMGVRSDWPMLVSILNKGLAHIGRDGLSGIVSKWIQVSMERTGIELTPKERDWIRAHPVVRLGIDQSWEPFVYIEHGKAMRGFEVEFLETISRLIGMRIELVPGHWADLVEQAKRRELDGLAQSATSEERAEWFRFSDIYMSHYYVLVTTSDNTASIRKPADLVGRRVALQAGNAWLVKLVESFGDIQVVEAASQTEAFGLVMAGKADAACVGAEVIRRIVMDHHGYGAKIVHVFNKNRLDVVYSIRKDWPEFVPILNKALTAITEKEKDGLLKKYMLEIPTVPGTALDLTPEEQAWLAQNHTIRVSFWLHPPIFYIRDAKVVGIAVDFLNRITEITGITFQFEDRLDRFSDVLQGLKEHEGPDLVGALMPTAEREENILFTEPYFASPRFIFTRDDAPFVSSIEDLFDKNIAVVEDYVVHDTLAENYPDIGLLICSNNEEALRAVSMGEAFAFIGDLVATPAMINEFGLRNLKAACPSGLPDHPLAMGIRDDWPELRDILNKALEAIPADEKAATMNKWSTVRVEHGIRPVDVFKSVLIVFSIAALIILFFVTWNRTLKRRVKERTFNLTESEKRFRSTFEQAAVGIAHVSPDGRFLRINKKFCDIVGYSHNEMISLTFQDITFPDDLNADMKEVKRLLAGEGNVYTMDKRYIRKNGELVWTQLTVSLVRNEADQPQWFVSVIKDITERKRAEEGLRSSKERFQKVFQASPASITITNLSTGLFVEVNQSFERDFGYPREDVIGKSPLDVNIWKNPEDRARYLPLLLEQGHLHISELELVRKSGEIAIADVYFSIMRIGDADFSIAAFSDITERKKAEEQLQEYQQRLKALASQLIIAEEQERRRIAADLHDNVQQSLALARLQLAAARKSTSEEKLTATLDEISESIRQAVADTRSLVYDLSSPSMNEIGISAAISEWLAEQIQKKHGLKTEFVDECGRVPLDDNVRAILFRSVRELLTNVVKHAQAKKVTVSMKTIDSSLNIMVQDDGVGLDYDIESGKIGHFGLFSIRERMSDLGGSMEIISEPGKGTKAILIAPLNIQ